MEWRLERKKARRASKKVEIFREKKDWEKRENWGREFRGVEEDKEQE